MISIDTNVLVRVLVDDPNEKAQVRAAREAVRQAGEVFVSQIVQVETVWVLMRGYRLKKSDLMALLAHLLENIAYHLEKEDIFVSALKMYESGKADFSDYLILADALARDIDVVTFDRNFAKTEGACLLQGDHGTKGSIESTSPENT